jgi:hypothetical protein
MTTPVGEAARIYVIYGKNPWFLNVSVSRTADRNGRVIYSVYNSGWFLEKS